MNINERVIKIRAELGITLDEMGKLCQVSQSTAHQWESGVSSPGLRAGYNLWKKRRVRLEYLVEGKGDMFY